MYYSMKNIIEDMKKSCRREHYTNCTDAAAVARGTFGHIKEHAPETTYTAAEIYDLLWAMHEIEFSDTQQH